MRALLLAFACLALLTLGCNDSGPQGFPPKVRACGELEGVEPVEPMVVGEDYLGCPVFAPVPCTKEVVEYDSLCGDVCSPAVAAKQDGDAWLVGCETRPGVGCVGDYQEDFCGIDPFEGETYWWSVNECDPFFIYFFDCWESCDGGDEPSRLACLED